MALGALTRAGLAMEAQLTAAAWPSASPATVAALVAVTSLTPDVFTEQEMLANSSAYGGVASVDRMRESNSITPTFLAAYEGLEPLFACSLGYMAKRYGATVFPEQLAAGAYRHRYEIDDTLQADYWRTADGWNSGDSLNSGSRKTRRLTFAATVGDLEAWEWLSCMVAGLEISGEAGGHLRVTAMLNGAQLDTTPAANTLAALQALSAASAPLVAWHDGSTRMAAYSASTPLGAGDVLKVSGFSLILNNALVDTYSPRITLGAEEYTRGDMPVEISGAFTLPLYQSQALIAGHRAGTTYMADLIFTGPAIGATGQDYTFELYLPSIRLTGAGPTWNSAGIISQTLAWTALQPSAAAAGMPTTTRLSPLILQLQSALSTHPLE